MAYQPKSYKKFVATAATATLVASAVAPAAFADEASTAAFTDVAPQYADAVEFVVSNNISKGLTETSFGVHHNIERGNAAVLIANAANLNDKDAPQSGFTDVPTRAAINVNSLKAAGVVNGKTDTQFDFYGDITRGEAAIIISRAFDLEGDVEELDFTDVIGTRYDDAVAALVEAGVTQGKSATQFGTHDEITRGELAVWLHALEEMIVPDEDEDEDHETPETPEVPDEVVDGHELEISFGKESLIADGTDSTTVTLTLTDAETGEVATDADDLVLELSASHGSLNDGNTTRVVVQDGVATATLQSDFHADGITAVVTAKLVETAPDSDWHDQIGNLVDAEQIEFTPIAVDPVAEPVLRDADTDEADRVTLFFDKPVSPTTFARVINDRIAVNADGNVIFKDDVSVSISSDFDTDHEIRGIQSVAGNPNALEFILDEGEEFTASSEVAVEVGFFGDTINTRTETFLFTDAVKPEATSVNVADRNTIVLNFSEPVALTDDSVITINGGAVDIADVNVGNYNQNVGDARHQITVDTEDFLPAGTHSVQVSGVEDLVGNEIDSDSLDFSLPAYDARPNATVEVESPEQFRVNFADPVVTTGEGAFAPEELQFQVFIPSDDATSSSAGTWEDLPSGLFERTEIEEGEEYVYELNADLSEIFSTLFEEENYVNYSNYEYRAVVAADTVTSAVNGLQNSEQVLNLSYAGSPLSSLDNASPEFVGTPYQYINEADGNEGFVVSFNEPVKAPGLDIADTDEAPLDTPSVEQGTLPELIVEFQGTNADGQNVTVAGDVVGYFPDAVDELQLPFVNPLADTSADNQLLVNVAEGPSLQALTDSGYGEEWTLVVRNVTDDVGNAAVTLSNNFTVAATPEEFEVEDVEFFLNGDADDTIVIDFSEAYGFTGNETNALRAQNYILNSAALQGATVVAGDDDTVVITLPDGSLREASNTITISDALTSVNGTVLSGENTFVEVPGDEGAEELVSSFEAEVDTVREAVALVNDNDLRQTVGAMFTPAINAARLAAEPQRTVLTDRVNAANDIVIAASFVENAQEAVENLTADNLGAANIALGSAEGNVGSLPEGDIRDAFLDLLLEVEADIDAFEAQLDADAAAAVSVQLEELPLADAVTLQSEDEIVAARVAFDALNADQQALVDQSLRLRLADAETALNVLLTA